MQNTLKEKKYLLAMLAIFFLATFLLPGMAFAQSDSSVVIQPAKIEVNAYPGQKIARSFSVINRSNFDVRLKLIVRDYKQITESGGLQFYDSKTDPATSWIVPQYVEIGLKPLETKNVGIVINVPQNISGGGHYGAILFQGIGDTSNNIRTSNFGELVLLTISGTIPKAAASAKVSNFGTGEWQQGNPVYFDFKMQNTGNTHFNANGKLILSNWLGKEIGNFNIGKMTIYPNTSRAYKWKWNNTPSFGLYKADMTVSEGASQNLKSVGSSWFIILPWQVAGSAILLLIIIFSALKYRHLLKSVTKKRIRLKVPTPDSIREMFFK